MTVEQVSAGAAAAQAPARPRHTGPPVGSLVAHIIAWSGPRLVTAGLLLLAFSRRWEEMGVPIPVDRLVLFAGLGLCVVDFFARGGRLAVRPVHILMALSLAWGLVSAVRVGELHGGGLFALLDRYGIIPFALLALAPALFPDAASRRFMARTFTALGLYLGVVALTQTLGLDALVWPKYILDSSVGLHGGRARGPYVEGVAMGLMLVYCAAFAAFLVMTEKLARWRLLAVTTILLAAVGVVLTLTRAVWLGAAVAALVTVLAVPALRRWAPLIGVVLTGAVALAFVAVPGLTELVTDRSGSQGPLWDRYNSNLAAVRMILAEPVTGVGWRQAPVLMSDFVRQGADYPVTAASANLEPHNVFLSRFAELGIPGAALWIAALAGATVFPLLRRPESVELQRWRIVLLPIAAAWAVAAMFGPLTYPQPNYLLWALGGVVLSTYLTASRPTPVPGTVPDEPVPLQGR